MLNKRKAVQRRINETKTFLLKLLSQLQFSPPKIEGLQLF